MPSASYVSQLVRDRLRKHYNLHISPADVGQLQDLLKTPAAAGSGSRRHKRAPINPRRGWNPMTRAERRRAAGTAPVIAVHPQEAERREHVKRRLRERYGFNATDQDIRELVVALERGQATDLGSTQNNPAAHVYCMVWRGIVLYPVYNPTRHHLYTVLPERAIRRHEAWLAHQEAS